MAVIHFTSHLQTHLSCRPVEVAGGTTVRAALEAALTENAALRSYILDDQNHLRRHIMVFVNGKILEDRGGMTDAVDDDTEIYVMQALSGG